MLGLLINFDQEIIFYSKS